MLKRIVSGIPLVLLALGAAMLAFDIRPAKADGLVCDLNGDGVVDFEDLEIAALAFGSYPGHPRWNPQADVNSDNKIDGADICIIAKHFGKTVTTAITVTIHICPHVLNLRSRGRWITAYIELPEGYNSSDIDTSTIMLNDTVPAKSRPIAAGHCDCDRIPYVIVKCERQKVVDLILGNCEFTGRFGIVILSITGKLRDKTFRGNDSIKVILQTPRRM